MPYPNEHSCRLRNPNELEIVGSEDREHEGKKYRVIFGKEKGEEKGAVEQAYRYPKDIWTADSAKSHCEAHNGSFEAAAEEVLEKVPEDLAKMKRKEGFMMPAEISLTESYLPGKNLYKVRGHALHAITTRHPKEPPRFYSLIIDQLKNAAPTLVGKGFDFDHSDSWINPTVNKITISGWNDKEERLEYEGEVDAFLARLIQDRKPVSIKIDWVIPGGMLKAVEKDGEIGIVPMNFEYGGLSIIESMKPGDPNAFIALIEGISQGVEVTKENPNLPNFSLPDFLEWQLLQQRKVFFTEDVNAYTAKGLCAKLEYLASTSKEPITLILNSPGGYVYEGLMIYNTMKRLVASGIELTCEVRGMAASMGAIILQAASKRVASSDTRFLIHEVSSISWGTTSQLQEEAEEVKKLNELLNGIISKKTGKNLEELTALEKKTDVWFSAQEALNFGLIDEILKEENIPASLLEAIAKSRVQKEEKPIEKLEKKEEIPPKVMDESKPPIVIESPELVQMRVDLMTTKADFATKLAEAQKAQHAAEMRAVNILHDIEGVIPNSTIVGCWTKPGPLRLIQELKGVVRKHQQT
jgi:ATP-dependent Clp protease protease subunit